jgi:hypothetical protein
VLLGVLHMQWPATRFDPGYLGMMARRSQPDRRGAFTGQKLGVAGGVVISASSALCSIAPAASLAVPTDTGGYRRSGTILPAFLSGRGHDAHEMQDTSPARSGRARGTRAAS